MNESINRRAFARAGTATALAVMTQQTVCGRSTEERAVSTGDLPMLEVRPYQLMCIICRLGEGHTDDLGDPHLTAILRSVRKDRKRPVRLCCNVDTVYRYQNPGHQDDTPEGELFNAKRDLDVLQKLGLVPGDARPAIDTFERVFRNIDTAEGICGYKSVTSHAWQGCAQSASGNYEKGHALGIQAVLAPRDPEEKATFKKQSAAAVYEAETLRIRPHHLLCMSCFFGRREELAPIQEDNLFEVIDVIQKNPQIPVTLVAGCCMICPPCGKYDPATNLCLGGRSMALRDQKKDLDVLQKLGLRYGDALPARDLYQRLYARIPSTRDVCGYGDGEARAPEWSICSGAEQDDGYQKARAACLGIPK